MKKLILPALLIMSFIACKKETSETETSPKPPSKEYDIKGFAQKGPYVIGAEVTAFELDSDLKPTGLSYQTIVKNNQGYFEFNDVDLSYSNVKISVDGSFFNETDMMTGGSVIVGSDTKLSVIADLSDTSIVFINVLTHFSQARMSKLVKDGISFTKAKQQAHEEILQVFGVDPTKVVFPERVNLVDSSYSGSVLFAVSSMMATAIGPDKNIGIPEVIIILTDDFQDDGVIDQSLVQAILGSSGLLLDLNLTAQNIINKYSSMGVSVSPNANNQILKNFLKHSNFPTVVDDIFPPSANGSLNFLNVKNDTIYVNSTDNNALICDLTQQPPLDWVRFKVTNVSGNFQFAPFSGWNVGQYKNVNQGDPLTVVPCLFSGSGSLTIEAHVATERGIGSFRSKTIIWN